MSDNTETRRVAVVIEDDADIRHLLDTVLTQAGFQVITAGNGLDGIQAVRNYEPLVTTLDVNMPGMDGFETARRIRDFSSTYLIMLTALGEEIDALQGLDAGADDYILKPFRPRELRARVEAMMRRPRIMPSAPAPAPVPSTPAPSVPVAATPAEDEADGWLEHKGLRAHPEMHLAQLHGNDLELTPSEFDILVDLLGAGRRVVSKTELVRTLHDEHGSGAYVSEHDLRAIEVHLANLRRKLGESATAPLWIETVRGVGYRLTVN